VTYKNKDVFKWHVPRSGLKYENPMLEWVLAARWAGYRWDEFQSLPGDEQSFLIAAYRISNQIEAVVSHHSK
jgi:hypothetical protein